MCTQPKLQKQQGFTLVEVMISIVVAMVVLAGLMLTFTNQSNQYQYQNKRVDSSQDLEFAIKYIARDLRSALIGGATSVIITDNAAPNPYTQTLTFKVWDSVKAAGVPANKPPFSAESQRGIVTRTYNYNAGLKSLRYDRESSTISYREILPHVTFFKVFDDAVTPRAGYTGIPAAQLNIWIPDPAKPNTLLPASGYTILIEAEVQASYKGGSLKDVRGNAVTTKRIWRYAQVYTMAAVQ
jgi:type II secretory pathway pseudopilin PulG